MWITTRSIANGRRISLGIHICQLDCPRKFSIAGVFCFEEVGTWSETVHALSALCLQKPKIHRKAGRTRTPANSQQDSIFDEIAPINSPQIGALGVHFDGLVHIMALENVSLCMARYLVSLGCGNFWASVGLADDIVRH